MCPPPSQPIDSYFFEVQYTFFDTDAEEAKKQVGIVIESATLIDAIDLEEGETLNIDLCHKRDLIAEHLTIDNGLHHNTYARVLIRSFERSTGRQAIVYDAHHKNFNLPFRNHFCKI